MIHIGEKIKEVFDKQPKEHNIEWFADKLHCKRSNIYNIFNRSTIDTDLLFHISRILGHDFFHDLTTELSRTDEHKEGKSEIYHDLMYGIGQLLRSHLCRLQTSDFPLRYILNTNDREDSPLPAESYIVSVSSGEREKSPFINIYSIQEKIELVYPLADESRVPEIVDKGNTRSDESFRTIIGKVQEWLDMNTPGSHERIDNRMYSLIAFNTLNGRRY